MSGSQVLLFIPKSYIRSNGMDHFFSESGAQLSLDMEGGKVPLSKDAGVWGHRQRIKGLLGLGMAWA